MKTLITFIAIVGFASATLAASNGKGERASASNRQNLLTRAINTKIHYPSTEAGNVEAIVTVNLTVNEDRTLQINKIASTDERVVASIKNQLTQIKLKPGSEQVGKTYDYRFVLKVQQ